MSKTNYWDQIEQAFEEVDIYETYDIFKQGAAKFPEWKIDILAVHWTMSEISNGGLEQFFNNSTGILAPEAVLGFKRIGKPDLADAVQSAMQLLGDPYPRDRDERVERLAAVTGADADETESFSVIPKWVSKAANLETNSGPFEKFDNILISAGDSMEEALDQYAGTNIS
jgi:hypothetical protein